LSSPLGMLRVEASTRSLLWGTRVLVLYNKSVQAFSPIRNLEWQLTG
jgi:hypothetical protein